MNIKGVVWSNLPKNTAMVIVPLRIPISTNKHKQARDRVFLKKIFLIMVSWVQNLVSRVLWLTLTNQIKPQKKKNLSEQRL